GIGLALLGTIVAGPAAAAMVLAADANIPVTVSGQPTSCALGDSWCGYCDEHPGVAICAQNLPVSDPSTASQRSSPGWASQMQPATNPGAAIIQSIYTA